MKKKGKKGEEGPSIAVSIDLYYRSSLQKGDEKKRKKKKKEEKEKKKHQGNTGETRPLGHSPQFADLVAKGGGGEKRKKPSQGKKKKKKKGGEGKKEHRPAHGG